MKIFVTGINLQNFILNLPKIMSIKLLCHVKQVFLLCIKTTEQELMQLDKTVSSRDTISD